MGLFSIFKSSTPGPLYEHRSGEHTYYSPSPHPDPNYRPPKVPQPFEISGHGGLPMGSQRESHILGAGSSRNSGGGDPAGLDGIFPGQVGGGSGSSVHGPPSWHGPPSMHGLPSGYAPPS
ncbi:hypothetical protein EJ02DRAFT_471690 [Clathrospora elynae]|uniref:Uncharacterized protein n=1 Tax=Clathrospora elynae TaxID=706981 RepID=A0A6A5S5R4_9PLEO|nr:hypothetical protein EJ02DRAFT_471690 [Clathrospora elynae]